jgi:streptogramin lyase
MPAISKLGTRRLTAIAVAGAVFLVNGSVVRPQDAGGTPIPGSRVHSGSSSETQRIDVDGHPVTVAVGVDAVWVGTFQDQGPQIGYSVVRLDPATGEVVATTTVTGRPTDMVPEDASLWVAMSRGAGEHGRLVEISSDTNEVVGEHIRLSRKPYFDLASGAGSIWVSDSRGRIKRIDPVERQQVSAFAFGEGSNISASSNEVWITNTRGKLCKVDVETPETCALEGEVGWNGLEIAVTEKTIWITHMTPEGEFRILRVDPATAEETGDPIRIDLQPAFLTVGEGSVWILQQAIRKSQFDRDGTVIRIHPKQGRVIGHPFETGAGSVDLAVGEGSLWVAKASEGVVLRIDLNGS